jgi:hypothetical protein
MKPGSPACFQVANQVVRRGLLYIIIASYSTTTEIMMILYRRGFFALKAAANLS